MARSEDDGIQWFIDRYNQTNEGDYYQNFIIRKNPYAVPYEKTDKKIKYCNECEKCWEYSKFESRVFYYPDFPSYGKDRKLCPFHLKKGK